MVLYSFNLDKCTAATLIFSHNYNPLENGTWMLKAAVEFLSACLFFGSRTRPVCRLWRDMHKMCLVSVSTPNCPSSSPALRMVNELSCSSRCHDTRFHLLFRV